MTREEHDNIILWAREAGLHYYVNNLGEESYAQRLDHFGRLYAAGQDSETEKLHRIIKSLMESNSRLAAQSVQAAVQQEREACAKLCDDYDIPGAVSPTAQLLAHAIRARGEL
jgi:hypothetical protein